MAQVTLRINGYAYTVGCKDGEEQHLMNMAAEVDRRIDGVRQVAGQSGEARMLVMAALMMADDLFEVRQQLSDSLAGNPPPAKPDPKLGKRLSRMAKRAEDIAADLEHP